MSLNLSVTMKNFKHQAWRMIIILVVLTAYTANAHHVTLKQTQSVFEGFPLELLCEADSPIDSCELKLQGFASRLKVYKGFKNKRYAFFGDFERGVCGIRIFSANGANHGPATCQATFPNEDHYGEGSCNIIVQHMPKKMELVSNNPYFEYEEGNIMEFYCTADGGFPQPRFTLLYDQQVVSNLPSWSKVAEVSDFGKTIECAVVVDHPNATNPVILQPRNIIVKAAPTLVSKLDEGDVYEVVGNLIVGQNATILVTVCAYPEPKLNEWTRAGQQLDRTRYMPWKDAKKFDHDAMKWNFGLHISNVTDVDLKTGFEISIWNELGQKNISISIKTDLKVNKSATMYAQRLVVILLPAFLLLMF